jgi:GTP-binding protein YchF
MLKAGIVGLPNVGKSTLFNAVTRTRKAEAANYPFCTIEPNIGIVTVPDERLEVLQKLGNTQKIVPAAIEFVDIAGLVKGASKGEGLGNQFLSTIREVDAIVHVVRCFESEDIHHVEGTVDPVRDIDVINTELIVADLEVMKKRRPRLDKEAKRGSKEAAFELTVVEKIIAHLDNILPAITIDFTKEEKELVKGFFLLTGKPVIYACNVAEEDLATASNNPDAHPLVAAVRKYVAAMHSASAVVISAAIENELVDLPAEDATAYLSDLGVTDSGVSRLIKSAYDLLGLQTYITTGEKETRAWTITKGMKAPQAAGVIHGDFERGFIAAQIVQYDDLVALGTEGKCREAGKLRIEGKEYVMRDGDVVEWRFNV